MKHFFPSLILALILARATAAVTLSESVSSATNFATIGESDRIVAAVGTNATVTAPGTASHKAGTITAAALAAALAAVTPEKTNFNNVNITNTSGSLTLTNTTYGHGFIAKLSAGLGLYYEANTDNLPNANPNLSGGYFIMDIRPDYDEFSIYDKTGIIKSHAFNLTDGSYSSAASGVSWDWAGNLNAKINAQIGATVVTVEGDTFYPHTTNGTELIWTTSP